MRTFNEFLRSKTLWESAVPHGEPQDQIPPQARRRVVGEPLPEPEIPSTARGPALDPTHVLQTGEPQKLLPDDYKFKRKKVLRKLAAVQGGDVYKNKDVPRDDEKRFVFQPKRNMNIPRAQMPQLKSREEFISWVMSQGVPVQKVMRTPKSLIKSNGEKLTAHAQSNIYLNKAAKFIRKNTLLHKLIIITQDGKIFDGNHHWLALMAVAPKQEVPMYQVAMNFNDLLAMTRQFPGVTYEEQFVDWTSEVFYGLVFENETAEEDFLNELGYEPY